MSLLNSGKVLCDSLASLTFSTQADIYCEDKNQQAFVEEVLQENGFWENMPQFFSKAYALGGGVIKTFIDNGKVSIDYITADCFIPFGFSCGTVKDGIFASKFRKSGNDYTLLEKHEIINSNIEIDRKLFWHKNGLQAIEIPIEEIFTDLGSHTELFGISSPMFAYFRPAGANNLSDSSALGISCFANCTDTLKALDIAFDSLSREFILGRKRIIVPSSCIRTVVDTETGNVNRYFDTDDEVFQALKCDEEQDLKITDNTCGLRVAEHSEAINTLLDLLCFQVGLSAGTLSFSSSGGLRTAAEVKSMETRTEITMQQNRTLAAELIESTVKNIIKCGMLCGSIEDGSIKVRVSFSDKQVTDRNEIIEQNIKLVSAGLKSKISAIMAVLECSEDTARNEIEKIRKENDENE